MSVILILILASLTMALLFLGGFIWAVRSGQFEDTLTPSLRVLPDEVVATEKRAPKPETNFRKAGEYAAPHPALRLSEARSGKTHNG